MDLTVILPSPNFGVVDPANQEYSGMQESLRAVNLTCFYNKRVWSNNILVDQQMNNTTMQNKNTKTTLFTTIPSSKDL